MCSKMVTTTCVSVTGGVKVGLALVHFSHQDWRSLDWFGQFTASQPFHPLTMSIMNGLARLRFEFIIHNQRHTLAFESWVVTVLAPVPYVSHQDWVCLDWFKNFTASQPFQCLIISIMNDVRSWDWYMSSKMRSPQHVFQSRVGSKLAWPLSTFDTKIEWVWTDLVKSQHLKPSILSP